LKSFLSSGKMIVMNHLNSKLLNFCRNTWHFDPGCQTLVGAKGKPNLQ